MSKRFKNAACAAASSQKCPHIQSVTSKLTGSAIFLTTKLKTESPDSSKVTGVLGSVSSLVKAIGFRNSNGQLSCVTGIGAHAWPLLFGNKAAVPKELHPFKELKGVHHAPSTPGDLFFHIRGSEMDLCFELAHAIVERLEDQIEVVDEVHGFKYFDQRDLLGFVDGTENPVDDGAVKAAVITEEQDPEYAGGSYLIVQKYLHDVKKWNKLSTEQQESIVGREKLSDIELDDDKKAPYAHNVLTNIEDAETGDQLEIVRDNMPFGDISKGEYGTYFISYACSPSRTEKMLSNMFVGDSNGNYDHILDYSTAVTGCNFFVPTQDFLDKYGG